MTNIPPNITLTPWDKKIFQMETYELTSISPDALNFSTRNPGHYTAKVDPLSKKKSLTDYGFYYCDTLIEPYCKKSNFNAHLDDKITIKRECPIDDLLKISNGAFKHGRFHRDFNLPKKNSDARYNNWLHQLVQLSNVYSIFYKDVLAGFIAVQGSALVLHAVSDNIKGRGLAKFLWTPVCLELFNEGHVELSSSISASNLAVLNLYSSLGFKFRNPVDVYHRITEVAHE